MADWKFSRTLIEAIDRSDRTQIEIGGPFNLLQCNISRFKHGEPFGDVVKERVDRMGASLGVAVPSMLAALSDDEEALVEEFGAFSIVFDRIAGVAFVVNDATGEFLTYPEFRQRFGRSAERWLELPPEARRTYPSTNDWRRAQAKAAAR